MERCFLTKKYLTPGSFKPREVQPTTTQLRPPLLFRADAVLDADVVADGGGMLSGVGVAVDVDVGADIIPRLRQR